MVGMRLDGARGSAEAAYDRTEAKLTLRDSRARRSLPNPTWGLRRCPQWDLTAPAPQAAPGERGISAVGLDVKGCRQKQPMAKAHALAVYVADVTGEKDGRAIARQDRARKDDTECFEHQGVG
jgi:hypothetical protein